jgi:glycosyltransferase involved in cell wall biosynthesis
MITCFYRNNKAGYSIAKVSRTFIREIQKKIIVEEFYVPCHRADPTSVIRNIWYVFKNRNKDGVNHITGDIHYCAIALIGCKSVLTIHDLSHVYCVENPIKRFLLKVLWYNIPLKIVNKVVCISSHTKEQLMSIAKGLDIAVIHNAVESLFQPASKEFNKNRPVVLQIGTAWNKNLLSIVNSLFSISCHLRIIGKLSLEQQDFLLQNHINYSVKSDLSDQEVVEEYKNCDIVCFCSIYEGFGMPIVEGNATGRCVITSAILPMAEIAGNAAHLVNPLDVDSIRDGFLKIISDDDYRNRLILQGFENVKRFQPASAAKQYLNLYNSLLARS